jgi:cytochrome P450
MFLLPRVFQYANPPGPANGLLGREHYRHIRRDLLAFNRYLQREYGDCVRYRIGPTSFYQFTHPDQIVELLIRNAYRLNKLTMVKWYFDRWMGKGLLLNEGKHWVTQRRKVRWAMQQVDENKSAATTVWQARQLLAAHAGLEVNVESLLDRITFYSNVRIMLGDDAEDVVARLYDAANFLHDTGIRELENWSFTPDWAPTAAKRELREAMHFYRQTLIDLAAQRRSRAIPSEERDLLAWLIVARDVQGKTEGMSNILACDEALTSLMGGKGTVSSTIMWAAYLLALHPRDQDRAAEEIAQAVGNRDVALDDFPRIPFTQNVILEAMRLYPAGYLLAREVRKPFVVNGYRLPLFAQVHIPVHLVHRDPRWFERPNEFMPDRFQQEVSRRRRPYTFIPFGVGRRNCVGKKLGYEQCVLVLATLLTMYRLRLPPDQGEPAIATDIVLHTRDGLRMILEPRGDPWRGRCVTEDR